MTTVGSELKIIGLMEALSAGVLKTGTADFELLFLPPPGFQGVPSAYEAPPFVQSINDDKGLNKTIPSLAEAYASELLNQLLNWKVDEQLMKALLMYLAVMKSRKLKKCFEQLLPRPQSPCTHIFREHMVSYL